MTERHANSLYRSATALHIGPSSLYWEGDELVIDIDEITMPVPSRIRGRIRVHPAAIVNHTVTLDEAGQHRWSALAPCARINVDLNKPGLSWSGSAYLDSNAGDAPLEQAFSHWNWSRMTLGDGTAVLYDVAPRGSTGDEEKKENFSIALKFDARGNVQSFNPPPIASLQASGWRIARTTRNDADHQASIIQTLEDTPFYARSLIASQMLGEPVIAMHESLSLDRFQSKWVQCLLPFRMPRAKR